MANFAVVIPAYNEAATLGPLLDGVLQHAACVIVVNDASIDGTAAIAAAKSVILVEHANNRGKAAALASGFARAQEMGSEFVVTMDGDGQHDPADIPRFLAAHTLHSNALLVGARVYNREQAPKSRLFFNRFANFWVSWAAGRAIADSQCGFRLYPRPLLKQLDIHADKAHSFVFESEAVIEAARQGFDVVFVPIHSCYPENRRKSHFRPVYDIGQITRMVARKLFARRMMYVSGLRQSLQDRPVFFKD